MKIINLLLVCITVALLYPATRLAEPLINRAGSAVISTPISLGGTLAVKLPDNLTMKQHELLEFAYRVALEDGHKHPQFVQGILMQESLAGGIPEFRVAGLTNKVGDRYFGVMQIKLSAAKDVMKKYPELWKYLNTKTDEELQARLVVDDLFNIRVGSKYALLMGINYNPTLAITAYNQGAAGAKLVDPATHEYTQKVKQHSTALKKIVYVAAP